MKGEELREQLFQEFQKIFGQDNVKTKWRATTESSDDFDSSYMYTPETDIAIGPYNINRYIETNNRDIKSAFESYKDFLHEINQKIAIKKFHENYLNNNPRCFIAIEVGGSGSSRKHLLGDMFNASILGKIGIVVGVNEENARAYKRIFEYVNFAYEVKKTEQNFKNIAILNGVDFLEFLRKRK